jgi:hypothetical protein
MFHSPLGIFSPVRLAYQPPAGSTLLSEQTSHQQPASSTLLSEQTSTSHQPPAKRTRTGHLASTTRSQPLANALGFMHQDARPTPCVPLLPIPPLLLSAAGPGRGQASREEEGRCKRDGKKTGDRETIDSLFLILVGRPTGGGELGGGPGSEGRSSGEGPTLTGKKFGRARTGSGKVGRRTASAERSSADLGGGSASGVEELAGGLPAAPCPPPRAGKAAGAAAGRNNDRRWRGGVSCAAGWRGRKRMVGKKGRRKEGTGVGPVRQCVRMSDLYMDSYKIRRVCWFTLSS